MKEVLLVFIGGGVGSILRFLLGRFYQNWQLVFPYATLTANFLSCLVFGAVVMFAVEKVNISYPIKLLLLTGFCGGFSTYSAFAYETAELFKAQQIGLALSNIVLNFALSITGLYLGMFAVRAFVN